MNSKAAKIDVIISLYPTLSVFLQLKTRIMKRDIKLIWDFRGVTGEKTAEHHVVHLKEYVAIENLTIDLIGQEKLSDFHSIAYMIVSESEMKALRDILKPHRGERV